MSQERIFLGVLLLLHLSEHIVWIPSGFLLFRRRGRGWEVVTRGAILETHRGSLHWVWPLPGLARAHRVASSEAWSSTTIPGTGTPEAAAFDPAAVDRRRLEVAQDFLPLRWCSIGLLALIWAAAPLGVWLDGWVPTLAWWTPAVVVLMAVNAVVVARRHRRAFPGATDDRWRSVLSACLSPLAAIRSWDLAQRDALMGFHPVAVAAALPGFRDWEGFASMEWRHRRFPENAAASRPTAADGRGSNGTDRSAELLARLASIARARGFDPSSWEAPPDPDDPGHTRYCPRCRGQFTSRAETCNACRGLPLLSLPKR
jgi:hypothetical protein